MLRKSLLSLSIVFASFFVQETMAQDTTSSVEVSRAKIQADKKALVAQMVTLTPEQAKLFWPLYDEFQAKKSPLNKETLEILDQFSLNYETITDAKATELLNRYFAIEKERAALDATYAKKFQKQLPGKVVAQYFQVENKLVAAAAHNISASVPLVK